MLVYYVCIYNHVTPLLTFSRFPENTAKKKFSQEVGREQICSIGTPRISH